MDTYVSNAFKKFSSIKINELKEYYDISNDGKIKLKSEKIEDKIQELVCKEVKKSKIEQQYIKKKNIIVNGKEIEANVVTMDDLPESCWYTDSDSDD